MTRVLQPELLDELPSSDPRAIHSRRDLRRLNAIMRNGAPIAKFVATFAQRLDASTKITIAEIGAGEGYIGAQVSRALAPKFGSGTILLIDRQPLKSVLVAGWKVESIKADVFDWLSSAPRVNVIIANLFLHHFTDTQLREMFDRCAVLCDCFAASEPRRSSLAEWFSRRVKLAGCNDVTRHDAEISVRAGFNGTELTALWPHANSWRITERKAGLFTHFFGAARVP